jgi:hypothetical protein
VRELQTDNDTVVVDNSVSNAPKFTVVKGGVVSVSIRVGSGGYYSEWLPLYVALTAATRPIAYPVFTCVQAQLELTYFVGAIINPQLVTKRPVDSSVEVRSDGGSVAADNSAQTGPRLLVVDSGPIEVFVRITSGGYSSSWLQLYASGAATPVAFPTITNYILPSFPLYIGSSSNSFVLEYAPTDAIITYEATPSNIVQVNTSSRDIVPYAPRAASTDVLVTITATKNNLSSSDSRYLSTINPVITFTPMSYSLSPAPAPIGTVIELVASIVPSTFSLRYSTSDPTVARVEGTTLTVIGVGVVIVTVTNDASGISAQQTLFTTISGRAPLTLDARFTPAISIDRSPMFPIDPKRVDAKVECQYDLRAALPAPRPLRPTISYATASGGNIVFADNTAPDASFSSAIATNGRQRVLAILGPLTSDGGAGFSETATAANVSDVRALTEDIYNFLLTDMGQCLLQGVLSFEPAGEKPRDALEQARNGIAGNFWSSYQDTSSPENIKLKNTLDEAVQSLFFSETVSTIGGSVFNASAVLPNVVGSPDANQNYTNKLMTGLMFNKGLSGKSTDESDMEVFYGQLGVSDQHVTAQSGEALDVIRSRQMRTFYALMQAAADFKATFEDVRAWEDAKSTNALVVDSLLIVPGSAFMETRAAALARSACRFMYLYEYFVTSTSPILSPTSPSGNIFDDLIEFNHGFWFQAAEAKAADVTSAGTEPSGPRSLAGESVLYPLSEDLAPMADIALEWNLTPSNIVLRQMYYLTNHTSSGAISVGFAVNVSQG